MKKLETITIKPAYGRIYKNVSECLTDWKADKDFQITDAKKYIGSYVNQQQVDELKKEGYGAIIFKFGKQLQYTNILEI